MEKMSFQDLIDHCKNMKADCLHCDKGEFCNQYSRWLSRLTPRVWHGAFGDAARVVFSEDGWEILPKEEI